MRRFLAPLLLCLLITQALPAQAQYNNRNASRWDAIWRNTFQDFEYWLKRLDTTSLAVNWEKRYGERWVRIYVERNRWDAEPEFNRNFLKRALNTNTRWPIAFQDADLNILAIEGLSSDPGP